MARPAVSPARHGQPPKTELRNDEPLNRGTGVPPLERHSRGSRAASVIRHERSMRDCHVGGDTAPRPVASVERAPRRTRKRPPIRGALRASDARVDVYGAEFSETVPSAL